MLDRIQLVRQDFGHALRPWKLTEIAFDGVFLNAFRNERSEFWQTSVSYPTRELGFTLIFHPERLPDVGSLMLVERIAQSEFPVSQECIRSYETEDGGLRVEGAVPYPRKFASYRLSWKWRRAP